MIRFILNDQTIETDAPPGSTVLDHVRYTKRLMGTKIGCREGDCGACTLLIGEIINNKLEYRSVTSCLMPLGSADGKHVVTVEGINMKELSPVQQLMVEENGTQCGFCTPGFIMSMTGYMMNSQQGDQTSALAAIDGNICRCTGYKSIERACFSLNQLLSDKPNEKTIPWLIEKNFLPSYFNGIQDKLRSLKPETSSETFADQRQQAIGGGTDLLVQRPLAVKRSTVKLVSEDVSLKTIRLENERVTIGAAVTVTDFFVSPHIRSHFPDFANYAKLVSSTPIRNMATIAGNIVNASPIGDMSIFLLALEAEVMLRSSQGSRSVPLRNFFTGYKQKDMLESELITAISFPLQQGVFHFEKVSKRTHLDIASVNTACQIKTNGSVIGFIHLSAGGVAPFPKYLQSTCEYLHGKSLSVETLRSAFAVMNEEIAPISDARGTADYKRLLLRQLCIGHFLKIFGPIPSLKELMRP